MGLDSSTLNDVAMQHHLTLKYFDDQNVVLCTNGTQNFKLDQVCSHQLPDKKPFRLRFGQLV